MGFHAAERKTSLGGVVTRVDSWRSVVWTRLHVGLEDWKTGFLVRVVAGAVVGGAVVIVVVVAATGGVGV